MRKHSSVEIPNLLERARGKLPTDDRDKPAKLADEIMSWYKHLFREMPSEFYGWCREALYQRLCARFKDRGAERSRQELLDLWTDPMAREHVVRFGDVGFYSPMNKRYMDLTPDLPIAVIREGIAHKRKFATEAADQANALEALCDYIERQTRH